MSHLYGWHKYFQEYGPVFLLVKHIFRNLVPKFDMPSASGYIGEKYVQEFGFKFMTCPQLVGTWVKKNHEFGPNFLACRPCVDLVCVTCCRVSSGTAGLA